MSLDSKVQRDHMNCGSIAYILTPRLKFDEEFIFTVLKIILKHFDYQNFQKVSTLTLFNQRYSNTTSKKSEPPSTTNSILSDISEPHSTILDLDLNGSNFVDWEVMLVTIVVHSFGGFDDQNISKRFLIIKYELLIKCLV